MSESFQREWRFYVIATHNCLIHGYLGIDDDVIWSIIQDDLPNLIILLRQMNKDSPHV